MPGENPSRPRYYRLIALLAVNLALAPGAPLVAALVPAQPELLRASIYSLVVAPMLLLSFWAGFGVHQGIRAARALLFGTAFLAIVWLVFSASGGFPFQDVGITEGLAVLLVLFSFVFIVMGALTGAQFAYRVKVARLCWLPGAEASGAVFAWRFSTRRLFVTVLVAALYFQMARFVEPTPDGWQIVLWSVLVLVGLITSVLLCVWATLSPGPSWWRILLALGATLVVGFVVLMPPADGEARVAMIVSLTLLPGMSVFIGSLLVVRSCGFRLLPLVRLEATEDESASADV